VAFEVGGVKAPQFADAVTDDLAVSRQALQGFGMDAKDSGSLIAIQERFSYKREFGHGSYAS
jgi:hypothetical protein